MRTIAVLCQKGGVGKTTLAFHLGVESYLTGRSTIIFNTDSQGSISKLADLRTSYSEEPEVVDTFVRNLSKQLSQVEKAGASVAVIDTPPHSQADSAEVAKVADFILIPCRPGLLDLDAVKLTSDIVHLSKKPAAVVFNFVKSRRPGDVREATEAIASFGLETAPMYLSDRVAFADGFVEGKVASEHEPHGKAAKEMKRLSKWIFEQLEN